RRLQVGGDFADARVLRVGDVDVSEEVRTDTDTVSGVADHSLSRRAAIADGVTGRAWGACASSDDADVAGAAVEEPYLAAAIGDVEVAGSIDRKLLRSHTAEARGKDRSRIWGRASARNRVDVAIHRSRNAQLVQQQIQSRPGLACNADHAHPRRVGNVHVGV